MKIRIGCSKYDLLKSKNLLEDGRLGDVHSGFKKINIYDGFDAQTKRQTFWHEAVHAMLAEIQEGDLSSDEKLVSNLGNTIYAFLEDNSIDKIYKTLGD